MAAKVAVAVTPAQGVRGIQRVFVLDKRGNPLMPCTPIRARELLKKGKAKLHRYSPFIIRLKDRIGGATQPIGLGVDPGSKITGIAIFRIDNNRVRYILFKLEIKHRSDWIHKRMMQRAAYRGRRRSKNLRHRKPRFSNRTKPKGWLAPSLYSRVQHIETWARRLQRWCSLTIINLELVRFDTQKIDNPEISGIEYQHGTLHGYEVKEYLLIKFGHRCIYCSKTDVPLQIDHVIPSARGGTDRITNLVLACEYCNRIKGTKSVVEFSPGRAIHIQARAKAPLRDASAVNSTRNAVLKTLSELGLSVETSTGGRTKFNRSTYSIPKTHALDAACVGEMSGIRTWNGPTLIVKAMGRGLHQRTIPHANGFPWKPRPQIKRIYGFATGDIVEAKVPKGKLAGKYSGRVVIRSTGKFEISILDGINYRYCTILQHNDGYSHVTKNV